MSRRGNLNKLRKYGFPIFLIFFLVFIIGVIVTNSNGRVTKNLVKDYYNALIEHDYEEIYKQLRLYDIDRAASRGTALSKEEAKAFFMKKVEYLKKVHYKINDYEIIDTEQHDSHTFTYLVRVNLEVNGESMEITERIHPKVGVGNVAIPTSEDPLVKYRDGSLNFNIEENWNKDIKKEKISIF